MYFIVTWKELLKYNVGDIELDNTVFVFKSYVVAEMVQKVYIHL